MKTLIRKFSRTAITVVLVILAFIAIFNAWVYYTESPWTRDARFSADVVAIAPDVSGLITQVNVHDNQLVKKGQILFTIDQPRYQKALRRAQQQIETAGKTVEGIITTRTNVMERKLKDIDALEDADQADEILGLTSASLLADQEDED